MILSIHIPKTGGQSFRARLEATFAPRILIDYGDWVGSDTPEAIAHRDLRAAAVRASSNQIARDYDIIHGHFIADKYTALFSKSDFVAFFRDPYQQTVSHYQFFARHPEIDNPAIRAFHDARMTFAEFAAAVPDIQSRFLGTLEIADLSMVGPYEEHPRCVSLFETMFECRLAPEIRRENVNPDRGETDYPIDAAIRKVVDLHRAKDVDTYRRACERFERLAHRYGV